MRTTRRKYVYAHSITHALTVGEGRDIHAQSKLHTHTERGHNGGRWGLSCLQKIRSVGTFKFAF